jgi:hypothetical protein
MRLIPLLALSVFSAGALQAQTSSSTAEKAKHDQHQAQGEMKGHMMSSGWKEMDAFHKLLGATYHPAEKSGDLKPLRASASDLSAAARAWTGSTPPAACNTEAVKTSVATISTDALAIANQVLANASDADLKTALTALHENFEKVEKACGGHAGMKH